MKTRQLHYAIFLALIFLACSTSKKMGRTNNYKTIKIGQQEWMQENLKLTNSKMNTLCYNDSTKYCEQSGVLYHWEDANKVCPKGWHLPSTEDIVEFYKELPGDTNANNGRTINKETLDNLNVKFVGYQTMSKGTPKFVGKGFQEIWLVETDSIWVDPKNSANTMKMVGIHFYPIGKGRFNTEATFTNPDDLDSFYANCRCIKN